MRKNYRRNAHSICLEKLYHIKFSIFLFLTTLNQNVYAYFGFQHFPFQVLTHRQDVSRLKGSKKFSDLRNRPQYGERFHAYVVNKRAALHANQLLIISVAVNGNFLSEFNLLLLTESKQYLIKSL